MCLLARSSHVAFCSRNLNVARQIWFTKKSTVINTHSSANYVSLALMEILKVLYLGTEFFYSWNEKMLRKKFSTNTITG